MPWCPFKIRQNCLAHPKSYFGPWSSNHHIQHCKYGSDITAGGGGREREGGGGSFSLFKTTTICFGCTKWEFSTRKKKKKKNTFTPGKKSGKTTLPPLKNIPVTSLKYGQGLLTIPPIYQVCDETKFTIQHRMVSFSVHLLNGPDLKTFPVQIILPF